MYPIFITDEPDARVEIASLPGQCRWGINKLDEFLGPLVQKGLRSVILFGVPIHYSKVCPSRRPVSMHSPLTHAHPLRVLRTSTAVPLTTRTAL